MPIVSFSLTPKNISDLLMLQKELGYANKSEIVRAGLRKLVENAGDDDLKTGEQAGLIVLAKDQKTEAQTARILSDYQKFIKSQMHSHLEDNKCIEVFLVEGNAQKIKSLFHVLAKSPKTRSIQLFWL